MRQSRVRAIGGDCLETLPPEPFDTGTELVQLDRGFIFIDRIARLQGCLQPVQKPLDSDAILKMGLAHPRDLDLILDSLSQRHRRHAHDHELRGILVEDAVQVIIQGRRIDEQCLDVAAVHEIRECKPHVGIFLKTHAVSGQLMEAVLRLSVLLRNRTLTNKP